MVNVDIARLEAAIEELKGLLRDGLLATDIWDRSIGLSLAGFNTQPSATALFDQMTDELSRTLNGSGFPNLNRYYLLDLEDDNIVVIQRHGAELMSGMLLNGTKTNLGVLISIAIPRYAAAIVAARMS